MYNLNGWNLIEISSTRLHFVNQGMKVVVETIYPTFMKDGKQTIKSYIGEHHIGDHKTIEEAMTSVLSDSTKWFHMGYCKGCEYLIDKEHNYDYWMVQTKMSDEQEEAFDSGWAKAHGAAY